MALTRDPSPEVQLQAVLTMGEAHDPSRDVALAHAVRALPTNRFVRDAFYSGLANRELPLIERLVADPTWTVNDVNANDILAGLSRGVVGSRQVPAIERLLAVTAAQPPSAAPRTTALISGIVMAITGPGAPRRALHFPKEPDGLAALMKHPEYAAQFQKTTPPALSTADLLVWPGKPGVAAAVVPPPLTAEEQARFDAGKTVFTTICASCHLQDGRGQDGLAPPLVDSDWILGSPQATVRIVMYGLSGAINVSGKNYIGEMPGLGALTDDQIASVLTYLRREWGHTAAPVDPELVKSIRAATAGRVTPYGWREMNPYRQ
jgi:mono/diheme cytochrome c family protein